ncbi:hypothetical protein [Mycoplasma sp. 1012]
MIKIKDVIKMRIPFPNKFGYLARKSHMYICINKVNKKCEFIKCQTYKLKTIDNNIVNNFYEEEPNIDRNPFLLNTLIDLDKVFITYNVKYDEKLKTEIRPNISDSLFKILQNKLKKQKFIKIYLDEEQLKLLNNLII